MKPIYYGFDGLEFSVQATIPNHVNETLSKVKDYAKEHGREVWTPFGDIHLMVRETGAKGGYNFSCREETTGDWFFKQPNPRDPWGIRFSAMSSALAILGLEGLRLRCIEVLAALGVHAPIEAFRPSRIDFAVDFLAPDFRVDPHNMVIHSRTGIQTIGLDEGYQSNGKSGRNTSVTAGKMPGRQVIIYDKREEVMVKRKREWATIWGRAINGPDAPPLDLTERITSQIWRVELRAGKRHLKDDWQINSWASLYEMLPRVFDKMMTDLSYRRPCPDTNRSRWQEHEIWQTVRELLASDLFTEVPTLSAEEYIEISKTEKLHQLATQILGLSITYAAIEGCRAELFDSAIMDQAAMLLERSKNPDRPISERLEKAAAKYWHLVT